MNLGRKYVLIAVAVIMFALSSVLLVQKPSYADSLSDNLCPDRIEISIGIIRKFILKMMIIK